MLICLVSGKSDNKVNIPGVTYSLCHVVEKIELKNNLQPPLFLLQTLPQNFFSRKS